MIRHLKELGIAGALVMAVCVPGFVLSLACGVSSLATWIDSSGWTRTTGTVTGASYDARNRKWNVHYRYTGGGQPQGGSYRRRAEAKAGDPLAVIFDPDSPERSAPGRGDLFGMTEAMTWVLIACLGFVIVIVPVNARRAVRARESEGTLAEAEQVAVQAYLDGRRQDAARLLEALVALLEAAEGKAGVGTPYHRWIKLRQVQCFGRLSGLHREAARDVEAEECAQAAFAHSQVAQCYSPLDPPIEHPGHVARYVEAEDRRLRERAQPRR